MIVLSMVEFSFLFLSDGVAKRCRSQGGNTRTDPITSPWSMHLYSLGLGVWLVR